jgi:pimeloyl-ACP methyl ester carboxylesterase
MRQLTRNGVVLSYKDVGQGDPALLLIHGGLSDHSCFTPQLDYFGRGHRAVAVDLRGHGESDKPQQEYTIEGFADDVVWLSAEIGIVGPVVIGHSMGGLVALDITARYADMPAATVILDSPIVPPPGFVEILNPFADAVGTSKYREVIQQFMEPFVGFADAPARRERLLARMMGGPQHVIASTLRNYLTYDTAKSAAACKVPLLYIAAGSWFTDVARFRELCPQLVTGQTVGSGHYHQLEVPEQINAMIDRFLKTALA